MKKLTQTEFDILFQNMRDWPLETSYLLYDHMFTEFNNEIEELKKKINSIPKRRGRKPKSEESND